MSKSFSLNTLTEGISDRNNSAEGTRLVEKWTRTGLLRGLEGVKRDNMARLLENQAAQVLRESNTLGNGAGGSSGDLRGFTSIAFPIVRRVFGGLVANELVSIQPMSLPSGLLFYLDYTYGTNVGGDSSITDGVGASSFAQTYTAGQSIYTNPTGKNIQQGSLATGGQYDLVGSTFSKVHKIDTTITVTAAGAYQGGAWTTGDKAYATGTDGVLLQFDPQITNLIESDASLTSTGQFQFMILGLSSFATDIDLSLAKDVSLYTAQTTAAGIATATGLAPIPATIQGGTNVLNIRRLNQLGTWDGARFTPNALVALGDTGASLLAVVSGAWGNGSLGSTGLNLSASYAIADTFDTPGASGDTLVIPSFESNFATTPAPLIPEIDIKIESIAVTASTRKLRARWSPELAQDLNAYHSLDAEVELTQILSEQIALELDREILNDLLTQANGANFFWSRSPGKFVNKTNGSEIVRASSLTPGPTFTGTVREWYETLTETVIDVANEIHRKTLRGSANFMVVSPDVATILEASVLYKPSYSLDGQGQVGSSFSIGATPIGSLSNRFTVYKDPYFPRNKILVGYKGGSYLETGYVYAPYVPLIVTPTIFAPEDFTPRKGVMTRYGKKMVRSDFYGTVTCLDLNII
jgi:hypothetical protein